MIVDFSIFFQRINEQLRLMLIMLEREAVMRQIIYILGLLLISWLIPKLIDALLKRLDRRPEAKGADSATDPATPAAPAPNSRRVTVLRWLRAIDFTLFPALWLLLCPARHQPICAERLAVRSHRCVDARLLAVLDLPLRGWHRAGCPARGNLAPLCCAGAAAHRVDSHPAHCTEHPFLDAGHRRDRVAALCRHDDQPWGLDRRLDCSPVGDSGRVGHAQPRQSPAVAQRRRAGRGQYRQQCDSLRGGQPWRPDCARYSRRGPGRAGLDRRRPLGGSWLWLAGTLRQLRQRHRARLRTYRAAGRYRRGAGHARRGDQGGHARHGAQDGRQHRNLCAQQGTHDQAGARHDL